MSAIYALGYDHKTDDYKLAVCVNKTPPESKDIVLQFYSLASNSWKPGPTVPYSFRYTWRCYGVLVNGCHHWSVKKPLHKYFLLSLDMCDESIKEIQLPKELLEKSGKNDPIILGLLEGSLCILDSSYANGVNIIVWEMLDYGVHESWTRRYIITHESIIRGHVIGLVALWSFENGKILFMNSGGLVLYDPEHGDARILSKDRSFNSIDGNYIESLVFLKSGNVGGGAKGGIRETRRRRIRLRRKKNW